MISSADTLSGVPHDRTVSAYVDARKTAVLSLFKAIDNLGWSDVEQYFHENVRYERPGYEPIVGREKLMHFYREVRIIKEGRHHINSILVEEELAMCQGLFVGSSKKCEPLNVRFVDWYRFDGPIIVARCTYFFSPSV